MRPWNRSGRSGNDAFSQFVQERCGVVPTETGVGDRDAVGKRHTLFPGLFARIEIAFKHETHDRLTPFAELPEHFPGHHGLARVILVGVVVRAIDHNRPGNPFACDGSFGFGDVLRVIIRPATASSQHDMAVGISHRLDDGGLSIGVDAEEVMGGPGGGHGIHSHMQAPFSAVLESDRHGDSAGHLSMRLAFRRSGSDGGPADEVGDVLGADRIEQLSGARHAGLVEFQQNGPGELHAGGNVTGAVEMGIVDETFPSHRGSGLFEIGAHDDQQTITNRFGQWLQP